MFDIIIVGSGFIGSMLVYGLSCFNVSVCLLEKHDEIMNELRRSNRGLIYDPEDNSLKVILNLRGAEFYPEIAKLLNIDYQQVGFTYMNYSVLNGVELNRKLLDYVSKEVEQYFCSGNQCR
jgi:glycerol-3-phosphate dehydrogenase